MSQTHDSCHQDPLEQVTRALAKIKYPGTYCVTGGYEEYPQPGLQLRDGEDIPVPLTMSIAQLLVSKCHLAPYGHGEDTIINREVRNTWELNAATEFSLRNPAWQPFIDRLTIKCARSLGIDTNSHNVTAKLYKLLVYEVGGKFEKHHDSEKALGMFGSLVIVLPSVFTGGELVIDGPGGRHDESFPWDPSLKSAFGLQYTAFYGNCEHELKPVTNGYRVCLTYNLMTTPSDLDELPKVDTSTAVFEEVCTAVTRLLET